MSDNATSFRNLLCQELEAHGAEVIVEGSGIRLRSWPQTRIEINRVDPQSDQLVVVDLWFTIDEQRPESAIYSQSVGAGTDLDQALADAASQWMHHVAPPLLSCLVHEASLGRRMVS
jgi:hypothetical protein